MPNLSTVIQESPTCGALPRLICYRASIVASRSLLPKGGTMSTISPEARRELVTAVTERYQHSTSAEKGWILDEFVALTGYHRKHAIRLLNGSSVTPGVRRGRRCVYDDAVTEGLVVLWEASDRMCGKRLKALLPILVPALERHGDLRPGAESARAPSGGERRDHRPTSDAGMGRDGRSAPPPPVVWTACGAASRCAPLAIGRTLLRASSSTWGQHRGQRHSTRIHNIIIINKLHV